jgi:hypothetical protein
MCVETWSLEAWNPSRDRGRSACYARHGTVTLVEFARKPTVAGTVGTPVLLDIRVRLAGEKLIVAPAISPDVTCTWPVACAKPGADAVMIADPISMPNTAAQLNDAPCRMKMYGVTVTFEGSLLVSVRKRPPDGAG